MLTNVYTPLVGGVTRSIQTFSQGLRERGHRVLIVAPLAKGQPDPDDEVDVIRYPAIPEFYLHKYSLPLPIPGFLMTQLADFHPDVIHSHHPFLLGQSAQRGAALWNVPLVYTHHTLYEKYIGEETEYQKRLATVVSELISAYLMVCDGVIAPSHSMAERLAGQVHCPLEVIPTGVSLEKYGSGDGAAVRRRHGIPPGAFVVGHLGRLSPEKNCPFLAEAVFTFLQRHPQARFLLVGDGESREVFEEAAERFGCSDRLHLTGLLEGQDVADAYRAMNVFAFASHSETQGMVLAEAMAAGLPVVGVDASGVRDIVKDGQNGRLLPCDNAETFAAALSGIAECDQQGRKRLIDQALETAAGFATERSVDQVEQLYETVVAARTGGEDGVLDRSLTFLEYEWNAWGAMARALGQAVFATP
ncbi:glycosyltransferase [Maioricimonas rarisocia]|nr:glycosyltransferase [Maioricimonas rarisocia]